MFPHAAVAVIVGLSLWTGAACGAPTETAATK